ncbi:PBP1A family penicillin-binding protein [bacterium]|nr:PBP1A family penicillin-binding protein [bacterium]
MNIKNLLFKPIKILLGLCTRIAKILIFLLIIFSGIMFFGGVSTYFYFAKDLPNIRSLDDYKPPIISEVYSSDGTQVGEFWTECRQLVQLKDIPQIITNAVISAEDSRFYEHKGIDFKGILRAAIANVKAGSIVQGGSTITQQVTRSLVLSSERTYARKIREAILAIRIEQQLSKDQILELYLNQIYFGNRAYGIKTAARNYFHKNLDELNISEIALLAGMPKAPSDYSPFKNPERARERQLYVLQQMYDRDIIDKETVAAELARNITIYKAGIDKDYNNNFAPYFTEYVRQIVKEKYGHDVLYKGGLKIYTTLDLKIHRSAESAIRHGIEALEKRQGYRGKVEHINPDTIVANAENIQGEIEDDVFGSIYEFPPKFQRAKSEDLLLEKDKTYKAIVKGFTDKLTNIFVGTFSGIIEPQEIKWARRYNVEEAGWEDLTYIRDPKQIFKVGDIILVKFLGDNKFTLTQEPTVQSALFAMDPHTGLVRVMIGGYDFAKSEFNRTTQALRQTGSLWKPFVYAAALDKGYTFETTLVDSPIVYPVDEGEYWKPKNYGDKFVGDTTFLNSLTHSRNVPTVKVANDIGINYVTAYVRKLGLTTPIDKYLSMALGSNAAYLNEMVNAYSVFANKGMRPNPIYITKIEDHDGTILEEYTPNLEAKDNFASSDTSPEVADEIKELLAEYEVPISSLNQKLFLSQQKNIIEDEIHLYKDEINILYGPSIPENYIISPQTSYLMVEMLKNVVQNGTGHRAKELGKPVAGKTGTTNDETDAWFIGFVPDLVAGIWIGYDNIKPIGKNEAGGRTAAPIFLEFMQEVTKDWEAKDFEAPKGLDMENIATLTGGSCPYERKESIKEEAASQKENDRAVDFFDEDI